uniref:Uncharacterized protein n=1 Tax=Mus spicilegus TaxID=10103 RepID=A0A8C6GRE0_MUSSI
MSHRNSKPESWACHRIWEGPEKPTCSRFPEGSDNSNVKASNSKLPQPTGGVSSHHSLLPHDHLGLHCTSKWASLRLPPSPPRLPARRTRPPSEFKRFASLGCTRDQPPC